MFKAVLQATEQPFSFYQTKYPERTRRPSQLDLTPQDRVELRKKFKANPVPASTHEVSSQVSVKPSSQLKFGLEERVNI